MADQDPQVTAWLKGQIQLQEAALDVITSLGGFAPLRDLTFQVADVASGAPGPAVQPPWYQLNLKRGELLPIYRNEYELRLIRDRSRIICAYNEFAICGLENRKNYVVGTGFQYRAEPRDRDDPDDRRLAASVQRLLDLWCEVNDLPTLESEVMHRLDEDGEVFIRRFPDRNGIDHLRFVEPEHVKSPTGDMADPATSFGIECDPEDIETVRGYWVVENPIPDGWQPTFVPAEEVAHAKLNSRRTAKRGLPTLLSVEANLRRCEDLLASLTSIARARAKIALIRKLTGVTAPTAEQLLSKLTNIKATDPATGEELNIERLRYGTILTVGANADYQFPAATIGAGDFVEVLQAELRAVASRLQMPEWMFTALPDAKYSNAFVVESPALRAFSRLQQLLAGLFGNGHHGARASLAWRQVKAAVAAGLLDRDVLARVRVCCGPPSLETRDRAAEASTNIQLVSAGIKSKRQARSDLGLDPEAEAEQVQAEQQEQRLNPLDEWGDLQEGFTGIITDSRGRKLRYEDGKRVPLHGDEAKASKPRGHKSKSSKSRAARAVKVLRKANKKAIEILRAGFKISKKLMAKTRKRVARAYKKLKRRYGAGYARLIVAAGLAGLPIPLPGASMMMAAPVLAIAELHRQISGGPKPRRVPRGVRAAAEQFVAEVQGKPAEKPAYQPAYQPADKPAEKPAKGHTVTKLLVEGIESAGLPEEKRLAYRQALAFVLGRLPKAALDMIASNLRGVTFYPSVKALGVAVLEKSIASTSLSEERRAELSKLLDKVRDGRASVGGAYANSNQTLHLDGGLAGATTTAGPLLPSNPTHHLYAHELTHAMDGPDHALSSSEGWMAAFREEIDVNGDPLTAYARTKPAEALAEFARLVYASDHPPEKIEAAFPKASAFFKEHGLWRF